MGEVVVSSLMVKLDSIKYFAHAIISYKLICVGTPFRVVFPGLQVYDSKSMTPKLLESPKPTLSCIRIFSLSTGKVKEDLF